MVSLYLPQGHDACTVCRCATRCCAAAVAAALFLLLHATPKGLPNRAMPPLLPPPHTIQIQGMSPRTPHVKVAQAQHHLCGNHIGNSAAPPPLPLEAALAPCVHSSVVLPLPVVHACMPFTSPR
jgi:hypothetical protein